MGTDLVGKIPKYRDIKEIMKQDSLKVKLESYVDEAVKCKQKIQYEQENIKALKEHALDELGIKPVVFNNYVQMVFSNDYTERKVKLEELVDLIDCVMQQQSMLGE